MNVVLGVGFDLSAPRRIAKKKNDFRCYVPSVYFIKLTVLLTWLVASFVFLELVDRFDYILYLSMVVTGIGLILTPQWFLMGKQKMGVITAVGISSKALLLAFVFLFVKRDEDLQLLYSLYSLSFFLPGVIVSGYVFYEYNVKFELNLKYTLFVFKDTLHFFFSRIAVSLYTTSCGLILGAVGGSAQLSIYSVSEKLYVAAQSLMYPITNSIYPYLSRTRNKKVAKKLFFGSVVISVLGVSIGFQISEILIVNIFGPSYKSSVEVLNIFIITLSVVFPSLMLGYPILSSFGYSKKTNQSVYFGVVVFFIVLSYFFFMRELTPRAMAFSVLSSECAVFLNRLSVFFKYFIRDKK